MLQVILWILKLIGILLLIVLAVLLLVLLLVLFAPIRYRFRAEYEEKLNGSGRVRWLYPLLEVQVEIRENQPTVRIRIVGILLERIKEYLERRKRKKIEKARIVRRKQKAKQAGKRSEKKVESKQVKPVKQTKPISEEKAPQDKPVTITESRISEEKNAEPAKTLTQNRAKATWRKRLTGKIRAGWQKIKDIIKKILDFLGNARQKIMELWQKVTGLWAKWEEVREILRQDTTKESLKLIYGQLKSLLRHLKPKKWHLWMHYGTGDPYTLGQHLTALAIVYGFLGEHLEIEPEWEEKILQAKGEVKGRIRIFTLFRICIKVISNENVKVLWKQISGFGKEKTI